MKYLLNLFVLQLLFGVFVSCSDAQEEIHSSVQINNAPLKAALKDRGFEFDEKGDLVQNKRVTTTTSLDLSGCSLNSIVGLSVFESLTDVDLSDNYFGETFDFNGLPKSVKVVNLMGNDSLLDYRNLAYWNSQTSEYVAMRQYTILKLPASAQWNMNSLLYYRLSSAGQCTDMKYFDTPEQGTDYTVHRAIPDVTLRAFLKSLYPSVFIANDSIDLSRPIKENADLIMDVPVSDLDGVEYFLCNPSYKGLSGKVLLMGSADAHYQMNWIRPVSAIRKLIFQNIDTPNGMILDGATGLSSLSIYNNVSLKQLLLPASFFECSVANTNVQINSLSLRNCPSLEELKLPNKDIAMGLMLLSDLPMLKALDLSGLKMVHTLALNNLGHVSVTMPSALSLYVDGWGNKDDARKLVVAIGNDMKGNANVSAFLDAQGKSAFLLDYSHYYLNQ